LDLSGTATTKALGGGSIIDVLDSDYALLKVPAADFTTHPLAVCKEVIVCPIPK
jgi:hypothetical protein